MSNDDEPSPSEYLKGLAERLRSIPVMYGTDEYDIDRLHEIADSLTTGHAHNFAIVETVRKRRQEPGGLVAWIRIDRYYCKTCLEQQQSHHEEHATFQPEWW
jgi:hypothetical protein